MPACTRGATTPSGRAPQYASKLGKREKCQTLFTVTLAPDEFPVLFGLRLILPESGTRETEQLIEAGVSDAMRTFRRSRRSPLTRFLVVFLYRIFCLMNLTIILQNG
ncbi:transposase [Rhizobium sp. PL01]|uniref:transposase n=1 Tax=Rhizobium sp. PL01 TaxID=3085631 RepID=UPI003992A9A0